MSRIHEVCRGGVRLVVEDHHPERRDLPTVLLAHATGFCRQVWSPVLERLDGVARVVTLDQRGHGDSDKPEYGYEFEQFGFDLVGVIEELDLRDLTAVGHSKGGAAVARMASILPERLRTVILLDPVLIPAAVGPGVAQSNALAEAARRRRLVWSSREEMLESWSRREPFVRWAPAALRAYVEGGTRMRADGGVELKCPGEIEAMVYEGGARSGSLGWLEAIESETLLVSGGDSLTLPPELARHAAARLRRGRLILLEGVGHFIPMERPEAIATLIREALEVAQSPA